MTKPIAFKVNDTTVLVEPNEVIKPVVIGSTNGSRRKNRNES